MCARVVLRAHEGVLVCADAFKKGEIVCVQIFFFFRKKIREIVKCFGPLLFFLYLSGFGEYIKKKVFSERIFCVSVFPSCSVSNR